MALGQRLDLKDVECGAGDTSFAQRLVEVCEDDIGAAADIDENVFMSEVFRLFYLMICNPSSV